MAAAECPLIGCITSHPHRPKKDRWEYQGNTLAAKFSMYRVSATSKVTLPLKMKKKKKKEFQSYIISASWPVRVWLYLEGTFLLVSPLFPVSAGHSHLGLSLFQQPSSPSFSLHLSFFLSQAHTP